VENYPAFLMAGVFVFAFTERSIVTGSNVMRANISLIRALYFPRASLPLAYVIVELQQTLVGMGVLAVVMLIFREWPSWYWFLLIPVVVLQTLFNIGAALIVARLGGSIADVSELIPFFMRIARYFCGVMFMVTALPIQSLPGWVGKVLTLNPPAVYISLARVAFMWTYRRDAPGNKPYNARLCNLFHNPPAGHQANPLLQAYCPAIVNNHQLWIAGAVWGVGFFLVGMVFFWRAESLYGRG
jgi:teichoic acid transport system permease protein